MSDMPSLIQELLQRFRQDVRSRELEAFDQAANICMGVLWNQRNGLLAKIEPGRPLSEQEQLWLSSLMELEREIQTELSGYWNSVEGE
jgi:hypothetical protein